MTNKADHATLDQELRQTLAELELCTHVSAVSYETKTGKSPEEPGGKRPPGGIDRREDRAVVEKDPKNPERVLRSADHYRRRLQHAHGDRTKRLILDEAKASLDAWRRQPPPVDKEHPMPGDFNWKRWVAESCLSDVEIARKCLVSRQYVNRIRTKYREAA